MKEWKQIFVIAGDWTKAREVGRLNVKIRVNGNEVLLDKAVSLKELLTLQQVRMPEYVTVQLNDGFISASGFEDITIEDGDVIEFLYFMGGGQQKR